MKADSCQKEKEYQHRYYTKHCQEIKERQRLYYAEHPQKKKERSRRYRAKHREEIKEHMRRYHAKYRAAVFNHYGSKCVCCGESHNEFLTIDHINNDGARHKREIKVTLYAWLIRHNFPDGFQTLCWNCNCSKGQYGYCPHRGKGNLVGQTHVQEYGGQLQFESMEAKA